MRRAVVLGGGGLLARALGPALGAVGLEVTLLPRAACDITDTAGVDAAVAGADVVVNAAAYTAVDLAEREPERAHAVNALGAGNVARAAERAGARLVHVSTDYVFDGDPGRPWREDDPVRPRGVYARTKWLGEEAVRAAGGTALVVRTGGLYGTGGKGFFLAIAARARAGAPLRVVHDQVVSPTWTVELARQIAVLLEADAPAGLYHATSGGAVTWYDAARTYLDLLGMTAEISPVTTAEWGAPAPRPAYAVLAHDALLRLGLYVMAPWQDALAAWVASELTPGRG